jgi:hypothetical protein
MQASVVCAGYGTRIAGMKQETEFGDRAPPVTQS